MLPPSLTPAAHNHRSSISQQTLQLSPGRDMMDEGCHTHTSTAERERAKLLSESLKPPPPSPRLKTLSGYVAPHSLTEITFLIQKCFSRPLPPRYIEAFYFIFFLFLYTTTTTCFFPSDSMRLICREAECGARCAH